MPLTKSDGSQSKYIYPEVDSRLPQSIQWKMDYIGERIWKESLIISSS